MVCSTHEGADVSISTLNTFSVSSAYAGGGSCSLSRGLADSLSRMSCCIWARNRCISPANPLLVARDCDGDSVLSWGMHSSAKVWRLSHWAMLPETGGSRALLSRRTGFRQGLDLVVRYFRKGVGTVGEWCIAWSWTLRRRRERKKIR